MKTTYKNIEITVNERGEFSASVSGRQLTASSMKSIKTKIDNAVPFTPFDGFTIGFYDDRIEKFKVIGVRQRLGRGRLLEWICEIEPGRTKNHMHIYRATPEKLKSAKAYIKLLADNKKLRDQMDDKEAEAKAAIGDHVTPESP